MTREIKFRLWAETDDAEAEMIYLGVGEFDNGLWFNSDKHINQHIALMQFTGLTDKNGKEIYEGDIMKAEFTIPMFVTFDNGAFCFENKTNSGVDRLRQMRTEKLEIIGNIYENPELLNH